jgi:hypothetical protein
MILEEKIWQEFHPNGQLWIDGKIGLVADMWKHVYDYRTGFNGYEGKPVVRLGVWTKYFDNGQKAWQLDHTDGTYDGQKNAKTFPSYRKDGSII